MVGVTTNAREGAKRVVVALFMFSAAFPVPLLGGCDREMQEANSNEESNEMKPQTVCEERLGALIRIIEEGLKENPHGPMESVDQQVRSFIPLEGCSAEELGDISRRSHYFHSLSAHIKDKIVISFSNKNAQSIVVYDKKTSRIVEAQAYFQK